MARSETPARRDLAPLCCLSPCGKEHYFLDLAAEEGWPKDKLREKIAAIRAERTQIQRSLETTEHQLDTGRHVFYQSLDLLDQPATIYRRGGEAVRAVLNRTFLTRLYVDARKVTEAQLREPFDALNEAYRLYKTRSHHPITGQLPREPRTA